MAILNDVLAAKIRQELHREAFSDLLSENPALTKPQIKAALQAVEDFWETNRVSLKQSMDTAVGQSISVSLAKKIGKFWLKYKWGVE